MYYIGILVWAEKFQYIKEWIKKCLKTLIRQISLYFSLMVSNLVLKRSGLVLVSIWVLGGLFFI